MYTTGADNPIIKDSFLGSKFFNPDYLFSQGIRLINEFIEFINYISVTNILEIFYIILSFVAIIFIAVIIYSSIRMFEIREKEHKHLKHEIAEYAHNKAMREEKMKEKEEFKNERWRTVLNYLSSQNSNEWKLAIIEADLMLFDLLVQLKFKGESLGDKLKEVDRDSFHSLTSAWEVHNIRNKIAHEGSSFDLSLHEAKRIISLYQEIFEEFHFI